MKKNKILTITFLFVCLLGFLLVKSQSSGQAMSPKEFKQNLNNQKGVLLDVRTPDEFAIEHIEGALNIDFYSDDFKSRIDSLAKNKTYFIYCKSGRRSEETLNQMKESGFKNLFHLKGGIEAWKAEGNQVVKN